jgi:hypothetical protein
MEDDRSVPSLLDIANQINNTLTEIQDNTGNSATTDALIKGDTGDLNTRRNTLVTGQQNDTLVCRLTTIANPLCRSVRDLEKLVDIGSDVRYSVTPLRPVKPDDPRRGNPK